MRMFIVLLLMQEMKLRAMCVLDMPSTPELHPDRKHMINGGCGAVCRMREAWPCLRGDKQLYQNIQYRT